SHTPKMQKAPKAPMSALSADERFCIDGGGRDDSRRKSSWPARTFSWPIVPSGFHPEDAAMSVFYLLPSRDDLTRQWGRYLRQWFPGLDEPGPELADGIAEILAPHPGVYVVFADDLP